jgi:hypothetical protein
MSLRSGKLPFLGSEDEFFYHTTFQTLPIARKSMSYEFHGI